MVTCKTSSTVVVDTGEHLFKVLGHSLVTGDNTPLTSHIFRVGGHDWSILYYPNGDASIADGQFTSVYIKLVTTIESDVTVSFSFCLQDPSSPATGEKNKKSFTTKFLPSMTDKNQKNSGTRKFVSKDDLAASGCLQDDCLVIKCTVEISKLVEEDNHQSSILIPPSNLSTDFRSLVERGLKADLTVKIGKSKSFFRNGNSKSFYVNTSVLGARSPALLAQLCGGAMEGRKPTSICITDMDAKIFEVLLHYIYYDCLPGFMEENTEEATGMAQDLLVQANLYRIERLKVMCERRLSQSLNVNTVSSTLDLAEQYNCEQLKQCCLKYMVTDGERLQTIIKTKGFEQLMIKHPDTVRDIFDKVLDKPNSQAVTTPSSALAP
ncbi:unnamed protein product [Alopecurus aequalis]